MKDLVNIILKTAEAKEIFKEYNLLLSAGFSDYDAEEEISKYFLSGATVREQGMFFILFALIQWDMGRMTPRTCSTAKRWLGDPSIAIPSEVVVAASEILDSPMHSKKEPIKPRTIKCPWKKGALLAYKISTYDKRKTSPFWNKYVLLRIIDIKKWPLSAIKPDIYFDESMYVALYNWVGDSIPTVNEIENLQYIPISYDKPISMHLYDQSHLNYLNIISKNISKRIVTGGEHAHYIYALDWGNRKRTSAVFTLIDDNYGNRDVPSWYDLEDPNMRIPPLIGISGFDVVLIKRLEQLFPNDN